MMQQSVEAVVRDRGSDELISVAAAATVADAVDVMASGDVGAVLVLTEDGLVAGVFSERDLLVRVVNGGRDPKTTPVSLRARMRRPKPCDRKKEAFPYTKAPILKSLNSGPT